MESDMFLIDNAVPFRNAVLIQGRFQIPNPQVVPGEQLIATQNGSQIGLIRLFGILSANYTHDAANPRYHISVGVEKDFDYRKLIGATLNKLQA
jgi:hypothetical protein